MSNESYDTFAIHCFVSDRLGPSQFRIWAEHWHARNNASFPAETFHCVLTQDIRSHHFDRNVPHQKEDPGQDTIVSHHIATALHRKHVEQVERKNEERIRLFVEHTPGVIAMFSGGPRIKQ